MFINHMLFRWSCRVPRTACKARFGLLPASWKCWSRPENQSLLKKVLSRILRVREPILPADLQAQRTATRAAQVQPARAIQRAAEVFNAAEDRASRHRPGAGSVGNLGQAAAKQACIFRASPVRLPSVSLLLLSSGFIRKTRMDGTFVGTNVTSMHAIACARLLGGACRRGIGRSRLRRE